MLNSTQRAPQDNKAFFDMRRCLHLECTAEEKQPDAGQTGRDLISLHRLVLLQSNSHSLLSIEGDREVRLQSLEKRYNCI
jgi:hypothetical protein